MSSYHLSDTNDSYRNAGQGKCATDCSREQCGTTDEGYDDGVGLELQIDGDSVVDGCEIFLEATHKPHIALDPLFYVLCSMLHRRVSYVTRNAAFSTVSA